MENLLRTAGTANFGAVFLGEEEVRKMVVNYNHLLENMFGFSF